MKAPKNKWRLLAKGLGWTVGVLVVLRVAIPVVGVAVANRMLPGILGTAASIENVDMTLVRGRVSTSGITIEQPTGFDGGPLFSLDNATVDVSIPSLRKGPFTVEAITIEHLRLNLIRNADGALNVEALARKGNTNAPATSPPSAPMAIAVLQLNVRALSVSYRDLTYDPPLVVNVADCNIAATNILFDPAQSSEQLTGALLLTALLKQEGLHDAFVGLTTRFGVLGTNAPAMAAAARIVGVELEAFDAVVPSGVTQTLGGSCVDAYVDLAMAVDILACQVRVETADNTMPLAMGGTPANPKIDKSTALFNLVSRPGMLVGGLVTDVGSAGLEVAGAAVKTTAAAGLGAMKMAGNLGRGLFQTAKGVATADLSEIGEGMKAATIGTVGEGLNAVVDTATTAVEGVGDTASAAMGKGNTDAWRNGCETRWQALWAKAQEAVRAAPYPRPKRAAKPRPAVTAPATP